MSWPGLDGNWNGWIVVAYLVATPIYWTISLIVTAWAWRERDWALGRAALALIAQATLFAVVIAFRTQPGWLPGWTGDGNHWHVALAVWFVAATLSVWFGGFVVARRQARPGKVDVA